MWFDASFIIKLLFHVSFRQKPSPLFTLFVISLLCILRIESTGWTWRANFQTPTMRCINIILFVMRYCTEVKAHDIFHSKTRPPPHWDILLVLSSILSFFVKINILSPATKGRGHIYIYMSILTNHSTSENLSLSGVCVNGAIMAIRRHRQQFQVLSQWVWPRLVSAKRWVGIGWD